MDPRKLLNLTMWISMTTLANEDLKKLYVHADIGGEIILAGELVVDRDNRVGKFRYARHYIEHPNAYSFDPINLPLIQGVIFESPITRETMGIAGALLDAGPDDWGKRLLISLLDPPPSNELEFLLAGSGHGTGSLYFTKDRLTKPQKGLPSVFDDIEDILETALMLDEGLKVSAEKTMFFRRGSAIGGARPKTFIDEYSESHSGYNRYIAKFSRKEDLVDECLLEYASMKMAAKAGIKVPKTKILDTALGPVYLIERFDIDINGESAHLLSAKSLINKTGFNSVTSDQESYWNLANIARQVSSNADADVSEIFRRMLFNIAVGNVDDHLKNHCFIKPAGTKDFVLSPCYDVVPSVGLEGSLQILSVGLSGGHQTAKNIAFSMNAMQIPTDEAAQIAQDVLKATEDWAATMEGVGLSSKEVALVTPCMRHRHQIQSFLDQLPQQARRREEKASCIQYSR